MANTKRGVFEIVEPCDREEETLASWLPLQKGQQSVWRGEFPSR